jgi:hypothetical protein
VLGQVLDAIDPEQRPPVLELTMKVVRELLSKSPSPLPDVYATVNAWADRYGPFGCIVHFLLDHAREYVALRPDDARRTALLLGHLQLIATGEDEAGWTRRSRACAARRAPRPRSRISRPCCGSTRRR